MPFDGEGHTRCLTELGTMRDALMSELRERTADTPFACVGDALVECTEAFPLTSVAENEEMTSASSMGIPPQNWMMGMADCIGEVRRKVLTFPIDGDLDPPFGPSKSWTPWEMP